MILAEQKVRHEPLEKYRLIAQLGHGGMAQVFLACASGPVGFNKLVVLKHLRDDLIEDPEYLSMFQSEARLAARLNHPNVVQTNEVGEDGRRPFLAMEYLEGQPLNRVINRLRSSGRLTLAMHVRVLIEALAGLHYAHELTDFDGTPLEVVHRDATPHNVFVTYAGQVKVVDFGIAKTIESLETRTGVLKGKFSYMAPEQILGVPVDRRVDIFSVGLMLWEALAGKRPFKADVDGSVLQKLVTGDLPSPRTVRNDIPEELEAICMKAVAHDREARYGTAEEMQLALEAALEKLGERPHLRVLGSAVAAEFVAERTTLQRLVEAQTTQIRQTSSGFHRLPRLTDSVQAFPLSGTDSGSPRSLPPVVRTAPPEAPTLPPPREGRRRRLLGVVAIAGSLGALAACAVLYVTRPPTRSSSAVVARVATLRLESSPPGATVMENGRNLGQTPLAISLDGTQREPRRFELSLMGHSPYSLEQPPTTQDVRVVVPLVVSSASTANAAAAPSPPPVIKAAVPRTAHTPARVTPPPSQTASPPSPLTIYMQR